MKSMTPQEIARTRRRLEEIEAAELITYEPRPRFSPYHELAPVVR